MVFGEVEVHWGAGVRGVRSRGGDRSREPDDVAIDRRISIFFLK